MNLLNQIRFSVEIKLLSELHIGTGETELLDELRNEKRPDGANPEVAVVARDCKGKPVIPATSLKGPLRAALLRTSKTDAERIFGAAKDTECVRGQDRDLGFAGTVWLSHARMKEDPPDPGQLPYWEAATQTYISSHVAIERKSRTAKDKALFLVERVPEGAVFTINGVAFGDKSAAENDILTALAPLAAADGLAIGAESRLGSGRLKIASEVECTTRVFDAVSGEFKTPTQYRLKVSPPASTITKSVSFELHCPGPYLTVDASKPGVAENVLRAARRSETAPLLPARSLLGALRTRAAWLWHLHRKGQDAITDDPFKTPDAWKTDDTPDPGKLLPMERLFGVSGWRGLLRVVAIKCLAGELYDGEKGSDKPAYMSVCLDRFSGGPLDGALYGLEMFVGAKFRITLALDTRGSWPNADDRTLYELLLADVKTNGLMLGHATNKGFGWFEGPDKPKPAAAPAQYGVATSDSRPFNHSEGTAGYRFVPISPQVVAPPISYAELDLSKPNAQGSVSGTIKVSWKAESAVCIGQPTGQRDNLGNPIIESLKIGGHFCLPGPSLRGMIRSIVEISSFSHLGRINSWRRHGVKTYERGNMPEAHRHRPQNLKAGWLTLDQNSWQLTEAGELHNGQLHPAGGFWMLKFEEIIDRIEANCVGTDGMSATISRVLGLQTSTEQIEEWRLLTADLKRAILKEATLLGLQRLVDDGAYNATYPNGLRKARFAASGQSPGIRGHIVCTGKSDAADTDPLAKRQETLFAPPGGAEFELQDSAGSVMDVFHAMHSEVGRSFKRRKPLGLWRYWLIQMGYMDRLGFALQDSERASGHGSSPGIPVFYIGNSPTDSKFFLSLSRVMRLPWERSVGNVAQRVYQGDDCSKKDYSVPKLDDKKGWDFARALFGEVDGANLAEPPPEDAKALAGRVAFGFAYAKNPPNNANAVVTKTGVLGEPRESFYPFYLKKKDAQSGQRDGANYDDGDAVPAGRKRYVVRYEPVELPEGNNDAKNKSAINFLPKGTIFEGEIRFHNLHPAELGALLWALTFGNPDNTKRQHRHQIGRAKAHGYGVLSSSVALSVSDHNGQAAPQNTGDVAHYIAEFEEHMQNDLKLGGTKLRETPQIKLLLQTAQARDHEHPDLKRTITNGSLENYSDWKKAFVEARREEEAKPAKNGKAAKPAKHRSDRNLLTDLRE